MSEIYPVTIIQSKYPSTEARWMAVNEEFTRIPSDFPYQFESYSSIIWGKGSSPKQAMRDLRKVLKLHTEE